MRNIPFVDLGRQYLALQDDILRVFDKVSRSGQYVLGAEVSEFEDRFAEYCGVRRAVSVANGSDALYLSLLALGVGPGDEVICPAHSFVATAAAVARTGATVVFCDVRDDFNIDPIAIEHAVTDRTKVIMPVHLTGRIADMEAIAGIGADHGIAVVEDAAQAAGATRNGSRAGAFGRCACFSLHPLKNLHIHGDGGIITTDDEALADHLRQFRNHGLKAGEECEVWGVNSRLDAIHAAIASVKLPHLDSWNARFREIAARYSEALCDCVTTPSDGPHEEPTYHRYIITTGDRDRLQANLAERGVDTRVNYGVPLPFHAAARSLGHRRGDFPVAERIAAASLSLPCFAELSDDEVDYVIDSVIGCLK